MLLLRRKLLSDKLRVVFTGRVSVLDEELELLLLLPELPDMVPAVEMVVE